MSTNILPTTPAPRNNPDGDNRPAPPVQSHRERYHLVDRAMASTWVLLHEAAASKARDQLVAIEQLLTTVIVGDDDTADERAMVTTALWFARSLGRVLDRENDHRGHLVGYMVDDLSVWLETYYPPGVEERRATPSVDFPVCQKSVVIGDDDFRVLRAMLQDAQIFADETADMLHIVAGYLDGERLGAARGVLEQLEVRASDLSRELASKVEVV